MKQAPSQRVAMNILSQRFGPTETVRNMNFFFVTVASKPNYFCNYFVSESKLHKGSSA